METKSTSNQERVSDLRNSLTHMPVPTVSNRSAEKPLFHMCRHHQPTGSCASCTMTHIHSGPCEKKAGKSLCCKGLEPIAASLLPPPPSPPELPTYLQPIFNKSSEMNQNPSEIMAEFRGESEGLTTSTGYNKCVQSSPKSDVTILHSGRKEIRGHCELPDNKPTGPFLTTVNRKKSPPADTSAHTNDKDETHQRCRKSQKDQSFIFQSSNFPTSAQHSSVVVEKRGKLNVGEAGKPFAELQAVHVQAKSKMLTKQKNDPLPAQLEKNQKHHLKELNNDPPERPIGIKDSSLHQLARYDNLGRTQPAASNISHEKMLTGKSIASKHTTSSKTAEDITIGTSQGEGKKYSSAAFCTNSQAKRPSITARSRSPRYTSGYSNAHSNVTNRADRENDIDFPVLSRVPLSRNCTGKESTMADILEKLTVVQKQVDEQSGLIQSLSMELRSLKEERGCVTLRIPECCKLIRLPSTNDMVFLALEKESCKESVNEFTHGEQQFKMDPRTPCNGLECEHNQILLNVQSTSFVIEDMNSDKSLRALRYDHNQHNPTIITEQKPMHAKIAKKRVNDAEIIDLTEGDTTDRAIKRQKILEVSGDAQMNSTPTVEEDDVHAGAMAMLGMAEHHRKLTHISTLEYGFQNVPGSRTFEVANEMEGAETNDVFSKVKQSGTDPQKISDVPSCLERSRPRSKVTRTSTGQDPYEVRDQHGGVNIDGKPVAGRNIPNGISSQPDAERNRNVTERGIQQTPELTTGIRKVGSTDGEQECKDNVAIGKRQRMTQGKRRRDNWTTEENDVFINLVIENQAMEEMALRRMLAKRFSPRRTHEQCANHLRILRAQGRLPQANNIVVCLPQSQSGAQNVQLRRADV